MTTRRSRDEILGDFIRTQREILHLSLRQLANLAKISNPYLSQIERGLYRPSADVLKAIAKALRISPETLFTQAGLLDEEPEQEGAADVAEAIRLDKALSPEQKDALLSVYRGFVESRRGA
jgi:transcriptional regulator with XRE-family HTH domain